MEFLSNAYIVQKFSHDPYLSSIILERERSIINTMNTQTLSEYRDQFLATLHGQVSSFKVWSIAILITTALVLVLSYLIIVRCEYKMRVHER